MLNKSYSQLKTLVFQDISIDDILRAIKKLKVLGNGFTVIPLGTGRYLVQSVPGEKKKKEPFWNGDVTTTSVSNGMGVT